MNSKVILLFTGILVLLSFKVEKVKYTSDTLRIEQLSKNTFLHTSYLQIEYFGKVACNGMIVIDNDEALIFDTPIDNSSSLELINWIENDLKCRPIGVVVTHFHVDCLGGLKAFHNKKIPSYSSNKTIALAKESNEKVIPQIGFENQLELKVGKSKTIHDFLGEGHTKDNIISYFPKEKILFGGCLIKEVGGKKGNLTDANTDNWSTTVKKVKTKYNDAKIVVPGHGKPGGQHLLNYTIKLFEKE